MSINQQLNAVLERAALDEYLLLRRDPSLARVLQRTKFRDLAGTLKPANDLADTLKPANEMADTLKPANEMGITDVVVVAEAARRRAQSIVQDLRAVQARLSGEDRAKLEKAVNYLEVELETIGAAHAVEQSAQNRDSTAPHARREGRDIHIHLHLEA